MRYVLHFLFAFLAVILMIEVAMTKEKNDVTIEWYGQSCFLLTLQNGSKILTDPYDTTRIPYKLPKEGVDVIFSTHDHFDHNAVNAVPSKYILIAKGREPFFYGVKQGKTFDKEAAPTIDLKGITLSCSTVPSFHDDNQGGQRGANGIIRFTLDGMVFVHLGDIGENLTSEQIQKLKPVDVLMIPVGGYFTIEPAVAREIVAALDPKLVLPMHYKTDILSVGFPIVGVDTFLLGYQKVDRLPSSAMTISKETLPDTLTVDVLKYHGQP
ncbi:MAG: MBL fold metallo-hydrolase [bacterium]|nr:MBL fold metallo-hydrolase [bacterium]